MKTIHLSQFNKRNWRHMLTTFSMQKIFKILIVAFVVGLAGCQAAEPILVYEGKKLETRYGIQSMAWHPNGKIIAVGYFMKDEVEVWDIEKGQSLFTVPSKRRSINQSGQELLFSPDGKYLIAQDTKDNRDGIPPLHKGHDDPGETALRNDLNRFRLASVWDIELKQKVSELNGPASAYHGYAALGMCWRNGSKSQIVLHRTSALEYFDIQSGSLIQEDGVRESIKTGSMRNDFFKFSCSNLKSKIVGIGHQQFPNRKGWWDEENMYVKQTPITLIEDGKVVSEAFSPTMLHNARFVGEDRLISYGWYPLRIWSTKPSLKQVGEIPEAGAGEAGFIVLPDNNHVVGVGKKMEVWDLSALKKVQSLPPPSEPFRAEISPNGNEIAVASGRTIYFYRNTLSKQDKNKIKETP